MSYALVIVERPDKPEMPEAGAGDTFPQVDGLTDTDGVFCMGASAWIFDTTKAIVPFGLFIAQASGAGSAVVCVPPPRRLLSIACDLLPSISEAAAVPELLDRRENSRFCERVPQLFLMAA